MMLRKAKESMAEKDKMKTEAKVEGKSLHFSLKHGVAICDFIRGKKIEKAIADLEEVLKFKKPIPMKGEIPHRKGIMSGRFPVKAVGEVIKLLRSLGANAIVNELELEKYVIFCKTNVASRPYKRFGQGRMKRCHMTIKLIEPKKKAKKK